MSVVVDVPIFESQVLDRNSPRRYIIQQAESYLSNRRGKQQGRNCLKYCSESPYIGGRLRIDLELEEEVKILLYICGTKKR